MRAERLEQQNRIADYTIYELKYNRIFHDAKKHSSSAHTI